jgi:hypothetical protein
MMLALVKKNNLKLKTYYNNILLTYMLIGISFTILLYSRVTIIVEHTYFFFFFGGTGVGT